MTVIKASCPICGEVVLNPPAITLRVSLSDQDDCSYSFLCPSCKVTQTKPANRTAAELLMSGGVIPRFFNAPLGPRDLPGGPPLDIEDLREFVRELNALPTADVM